jgi:phosphoglycolate phosphatase
MKYDAVLFDLDGTLVDTAPDFAVVLNRMRRDRGLAPLRGEAIREVVSNGARALVTLGFGLQPGDDGFDALNQELRDRYAQHLAVYSTLFPGLDVALARIEQAGVPWGVVTNKPSVYTEPLLRALGLRDRAGSVVCPDQVSQSKPHPEPMYKAAGELGVATARCVYIGDHDRDIAAGRNAGMATVAVTWGYLHAGEDPRAWQADVIVESAAQLLAHLAH